MWGVPACTGAEGDEEGLGQERAAVYPKGVQFPKQWSAAGGNHEGPK